MCAWRERNRAPGASLTSPNEGHNPRRAFRPFIPFHLPSLPFPLPLFHLSSSVSFLFFSFLCQQERSKTLGKTGLLLVTSVEELSLGTRDAKGSFCLLDCLFSLSRRGQRGVEKIRCLLRSIARHSSFSTKNTTDCAGNMHLLFVHLPLCRSARRDRPRS